MIIQHLSRLKRVRIALIALTIVALSGTMAFGVPISDLEEKINENQQRSQELQQQMQDVQSQIEQSKANINQLSSELADIQLQISENEKKLEQQKEKLDKSAGDLDKRLRNMYKNGSIGFVDVVLSSESVVDLISNIELVAEIYRGDKEVVTALQEQYDATAQIIADLQEQETSSQETLNELNLAQQDLYDTFDRIGASKAEVDATTADLQDQIAVQRAAAARAAAQQQQQAQAASYSSGSGSSYTSYAATSVGGGHGTVGTPVSSGSGSEVVSYAMQFVGNPYVWGGTSLTNGCDCSGFTMGVYGHFGIGLSHSSEAQRGAGAYVPASQRQPGDLMWRVGGGHVGIYAGNGMMVHASSPGVGIVYSSVWGSYEYYRLL